jgi:hypothetical protein
MMRKKLDVTFTDSAIKHPFTELELPARGTVITEIKGEGGSIANGRVTEFTKTYDPHTDTETTTIFVEHC